MPANPYRLPMWTWWLPLPVFHLASWLSLATHLQSGVAIFYLPFALGLVLTLWWGPRALLALYLNSMLCVPFWGLDWRWAPLHALPETLGVALCWLLLRWRAVDVALPETSHLLRFIVLGVLLPAALTCLGLLLNLWLIGSLSLPAAAQVGLTLWLSDSLSALVIATPLLAYLSPLLNRRGWLLPQATQLRQRADTQRSLPPRWLLLVLVLGIPLLLEVLPASLKLPLIGLSMLSLALLWGFSGALCGALISVLSILALPWFHDVMARASWIEPQRLELHFSILLFTLAALLVGRSLTDLRQSLARRAAMQQRLALANLALEASPLGVLIANARHEHLPVIYCNPSYERLSGLVSQTLLGTSLRQLLYDRRHGQQGRELEEALRRGLSTQAVLQLQRHNGEPYWSEVMLAPMRDELGLSHFIVMQQDVSARQQLAREVDRQRAELLKQSHLFAQTEDIADLGGWVLNLTDMSMYWSSGCFTIYEMDPSFGPLSFEEVIAQFDSAGQALALKTLQEMIEGGKHFDIEVKMTTARGRARWIRLRGAAEHDGARLVRLYGAVQDITERRRTEQQLRERDDRLRLFFEAPLIGMALTTPTFAWEEVNLKLCTILGRSREQLFASGWERISPAEELQAEEQLLDDVLAGRREGFERDRLFLRPDGSPVYTRLSVRAVRRDGGQVGMFLLLVDDISARYEAEARYRTIVEHAPEAIILFNEAEGLVDCNQNALRLFGGRREQLLGLRPYDLSPPRQPDGQDSVHAGRGHVAAAMSGEAPLFEWTHRALDGREIPCEVRLVRMPGDPPLLRGSISDISERLRYQREIERLAYSDELTGLPNRRLLLDRLQHAMDREQRHGSLGALLFIDLDHFKTVNDSLGHLVGDSLLREVTTRLAAELRTEDTLARMGGDEFVVLLEALGADPQSAGEQAAVIAERLLLALQGSCWIDGHELTVSASIGIALHPYGEQVAADVLKQADTAMYRAKHSGRNGLHFFEPQMQAAIDQRLQLQGELRQAIARDQLYLAFQPQVALDDDRLIGAEVLLRWRHPERGEIPPGAFIPLAEETGLIQELGHWVLQQACATLQRWLPDYPGLVLAVNLSPRELRHRNCVARVSACLAQYRVPPTALELEITEGVLVEDVEQCIANMLALRELGIRFAIDDFGTGYSSLTYLKRLPLDRLKIDRSFTQDLGQLADGAGASLVETILVIADNLGMECIAEGIETVEQLEHLKRLGCAYGQGYLLGRPVAEPAFLALLHKRGDAASS